MTNPNTHSAGRVVVRYHNPSGVREAYEREGASLPVRTNDRSVAIFFPEDDEYLVARVSMSQAQYLATIPGFLVEGMPVAVRPTTGVASWHEEGEKIIAKRRAHVEVKAQTDPGGLMKELFGSNEQLLQLVAQIVASKVAGTSLTETPVAVPVTHNIDLYEMMDIVDAEEAMLLVEEFDPSYDLSGAPRSAIYTRLVHLADNNTILFHRLNRRRPDTQEAATESAQA